MYSGLKRESIALEALNKSDFAQFVNQKKKLPELGTFSPFEIFNWQTGQLSIPFFPVIFLQYHQRFCKKPNALVEVFLPDPLPNPLVQSTVTVLSNFKR